MGGMIFYARLDSLAPLAVLPARFPAWVLPTLIFIGALGVTLNAASRYTRLLQRLTHYEHLSSELLGFLSALGANIPNYVASLAAFAGGHGLVGIGIIVGSNIYNVAVILALAALATPSRQGIALSHLEAREVRHLAWLAAAMGGSTLFLVLVSGLTLPSAQRHVLQVALSLLILALFALVVREALRPSPVAEFEPSPTDATGPGGLTGGASSSDPVERVAEYSQANQAFTGVSRSHVHPPLPGRTIILAMLALSVTLVGVVFMVQAAQAGAVDLQLSPIFLSLVVLAVATSLPNTVVAYQLARREGASTSVEEILSSNAINLTLGIALPVLFWQISFPDALLTRLDVPLLVLLGLITVAFIYRRRIPRWAGVALFGVYVTWVAVHLLTAIVTG
jgi:cation:H+ antiporter